jgi:hypothetical protein
VSKAGRLWFPLDVDFWDDPDILAVGENSGILLQRIISYSKRQELDGVAPMAKVKALGGRRWREKLEPLVDRGLVEVAADDAPNRAHFVAALAAICAAKWCRVVAYLAWNDSSDTIEERRKIAAEKKRSQRDARSNVPQGQGRDNHGDGLGQEEEAETEHKKEMSGPAEPSPGPRAQKPKRTNPDADLVFAAWVEEHVDPAQRERAKFTGERRRKVEARLRDGYSVDRLIAAVRGVKRSAFHMGENDAGTKYNDLVTILKNGGNVEKFEALATGGALKPTNRNAAIGRGRMAY